MHPLKFALRQLYALFFALDLVVSALTGGAPMETVSARLGRPDRFDRWPRVALDWVVLTLFGASRHCERALAAYQARVQAAPAFSG